ncbi:hypothetical protein [Roseibium suaedae]|uniref:Phospholipid-binding protein n=1 Tax=Roseibium suaedae TaxID=735517 RepID=A0A1M7AZG4_9HYPH|nr:hypothetical protein [Roseibium suaedae]SHL47996.1 hypothetical protein SAMN05444272_0681 [Roseibium suaedae]
MTGDIKRPFLKAAAMKAGCAAFLLLAAAPAYATADFELNFTFQGAGRHPNPEAFRTNYILACLPAGARTFAGNPADSAGPWDLEMPSYKVGKVEKEYTADQVHMYLWSCNVRPDRVSGIQVTPN